MWKTKGKSTITVESGRGNLESTQPSSIVKDFSDETSPRHNADDGIFPPISTRSIVSPVNAGGDDFRFICEQPRICPPPVADPKQEDGSIISRSKESRTLRDEYVSSPSVSPLPLLRPRNRHPSPRKLGDGREGDESDESTILWDEVDSPPPCKLGKRNDEEESDESVIRPGVEDDSIAISTPPFLRRRNRRLLRNLGETEQDEESHGSTIFWDEIPPALHPRHRAATIPIPKKSKVKGQKKSKKEEEGAEDGDGYKWAVNSLSDTASEEIWEFAGMNYPFEFAETRRPSLRSGSGSWSSAPVSSDETGSTVDTAELWTGELLAMSRDVTTTLA